MIYDDILQWSVERSEHFIFKYPQNSYDNIEKLISKSETAYKEISTLLNVNPDNLFTLYVCANPNLFNKFKIRAPQAIPHQYCATVIYDKKTEEITDGNVVIFSCLVHEIAHLLTYFWDKKMYHLEFLEEGLAEYLNEPKSEKNFLHKMLTYLKTKHSINLSLNVQPYVHRTDYVKAGSFVKFLIEQYGLDKFKKLYVSTALDRQGKIFYLKKKKLRKNFLKKSFKQIYNNNHRKIKREWKKRLRSVSNNCQEFSLEQINSKH